MKTSDFFFDLPDSLIARYPPPRRGQSRLMVLERPEGKLRHCTVGELPRILLGPCFSRGRPLLVFNNSRVRRARLFGVPAGAGGEPSPASVPTPGAAGGETEFLLINRVDPLGEVRTQQERHTPAACGGEDHSRTWRVMVKRAKRRRPGSRYRFEGGLEGEIIEDPAAGNRTEKTAGSSGEFRLLRFDAPIDDAWLDKHGRIPLPPYIRRRDLPADGERYQTVYADGAAGASLGPGASLAAPTAGLHFTEDLLARLEICGIESVFVTLHVGLGTFLPVRTENVEDHVMHEEVYSIGEDAARRIGAAKAEGRKILAVGTTSLRTLESAWTCPPGQSFPKAGEGTDTPGGLAPQTGNGGSFLKAGEGTTSIFIYPGYRFKVADALFTNFHTPGSTLLMLVSAFAGRDLILESYAEAVREEYRFFSYGDAMLIL